MRSVNRYSDQELELFKIHIEQKLERAQKELDYISTQISELAEAKNSEGDWMDNTTSTSDLELLFTMATRQRHHIRDLENAMSRIRNKSYGICSISGELIDKRRLMAVPATTKSLAAKNTEALSILKGKPGLGPKEKKTATPRASRFIISKPKPPVTPVFSTTEDDDDDDDLFSSEDFSDLNLSINDIDVTSFGTETI